MFVNIFPVFSVCAAFIILSVSAGPTQISVLAEKTFQNDVSVHTTLRSIEDRLRNLENSLNTKCEIHNGKINYYGQKIENIERDLSRFQLYMRIELDKISENISSKNYIDDLTKDRTIRKIDMIYERINHKLGNIEGQIDITNIKSQNAREMVMTKLEKMEESLTIRDADMEAELADAVAAIDDLKTTCTNMEENIVNATKETTKTLFKSSEKMFKKQYTQTISSLESTNKSLSAGLGNLQQTMNLVLNQTSNSSNIIKRAKDDLDENLNEYANKITDMYADLWKKTDFLYTTLQNLEKVTNLTRSEQQNGLRALMVQVGRKSSKQGVQSDSSIDNQKLTELSQKIDTNFENVMLAQNLFLESCHRVQMDESQLESQISILLDKLIDIFENKTSVGPKDIKQLENLIRTHDSNIRRNIFHITNNLLTLMQKTTDGNEEIMEYVNNQRLQLDGLYTLLQDVLNSSNDSEQIQNILESLQDFQQQLSETQYQTHTTLSQINSTNNYIVNMFNNSQNINSSSKQTLEFIKNIYYILTSIEMKINKSYLDYFFNKYNVEVIAHRFGKKLNARRANITDNIEDKKITKLILEIFGEYPKTTDPYDDFPYTIETNFSNKNEDIVLLCDGKNKTTDCEKLNNTKYTIVIQNETKSNCMPNYFDLIDVRSNSGNNSTLNCSLIKNITSSNNSKNLEHPENISNKCNNTLDCPNIINTITNNSTNEELYDIDIRFNVNDTNITEKEPTDSLDKISTKQEVTTEKWGTTEPTTEEIEISSTLIEENKLSEQTTETWRDEKTLDGEENYTNLLEEDSIETNNEFEYTNHEYH